MFRTLINIFQIPELRTKILFTIGMLAVYRIGFWVPLPGVNQAQLSEYFQKALSEGNAAGRAAQFVAIFSGGNFAQSTIFGLGIMPYISASIIFQLLGSVYPALKKIQEEGPTGRQKIQDWTRRATVILCIVQAIGWLSFIASQNMVFAEWRHNPLWWVMAVGTLTAGTVFLMWLGEQIDRFGIGNGVSMLIMAGILTGMPKAIFWIRGNFEPGDPTKMGWGGLIMLLAGFVLVVAGSVLLTVAQRRIPVQQAKHTRGRRVYGGQRSYLPLRVNHGGVMPVIFASSLMIFPSVIFGSLAQATGTTGTGAWAGFARWLSSNFSHGQFPYVVCEIVMIFFFSYFWITVQFNPEEMSKQLRDHGSFIPGLRPGPRTAEYLESVMGRITFVGAAMLAVIAVAPMVVNRALNIDFAVTQFLGGTGLLIVVSVSLDFLQKVEANLMMRNYQGFLSGEEPSGGGGGGGKRLRAARG
ncbi:MAG: preprotein translocase subunit SecY [Phycisphaerales bacterium]|jgi:preprotein translocase subunit SecY|nr:preprotein translocase subunit SecY [Phycisphaerales bacterium]